ncbi:hypothetical protein D0T49_12130 [Paludibacter sp. 221]|uniref:hypothetical protein n=1 Tax=Paludibacter sp. 221 TaxID=2302939 RepID=UPI0013CFFE6F|nr:hypothetical protein [Paludibacter sp. 221]NDV47794.1 hypothetical protein [Paludibacter sp. 221]
MKKTETTIEKDVFHILKNSPLKDLISGQIYRRGMRPADSGAEDVVVKFLAGTDGQFQDGVVVINAYVPDVAIDGNNGRKVENIARVEQLEQAIVALFTHYVATEYLFGITDTPQSLHEPEIEQHFIYTRLNFRRLSL